MTIDAFIHKVRVIVNVHREQAHSHRGIYSGKKGASKLFDGEEVEPLRLKMRVKRMASLIGVQATRHPRNGQDT